MCLKTQADQTVDWWRPRPSQNPNDLAQRNVVARSGLQAPMPETRTRLPASWRTKANRNSRNGWTHRSPSDLRLLCDLRLAILLSSSPPNAGTSVCTHPSPNHRILTDRRGLTLVHRDFQPGDSRETSPFPD